jgi:hypothetical protein
LPKNSMDRETKGTIELNGLFFPLISHRGEVNRIK